jgi:hypothetical protein
MNVHYRCHGSNLNIENKSSKQRGENFLEKDGRCRPDGSSRRNKVKAEAGLPRRSNAKGGGMFGLGSYNDVAPTALGQLLRSVLKPPERCPQTRR